MSYLEFNPISKMYRFKNAFNNFFDNIQYDKVSESNSVKIILFKKNGVSIPIDLMSTGEKQIVFRGTYLLKNNMLSEGSIILIDEPELSMHPKWQKRILKYYKDLFTVSNELKSQLIFASHSEHVLADALADRSANLVVILTEKDGEISAKNIVTPYVLPSITEAETNYLVFDIVSKDLHIALYGWLQEKMQKNKVKSCDDFIYNHSQYNSSRHKKETQHNNVNYNTICTHVRNSIHHASTAAPFSDEDLRTSIELLIDLCR